MGGDRALPVPARPGKTLRGPPPDDQRHPLGPRHRRCLAGRTREIRSLADALRPICLRNGAARSNRLGTLLRRRHQNPRPQGRSQSEEEKNRIPGEPDDHVLGRSWGGFGSKLHVICDAHDTITAFRLSADNANECTEFTSLMESVSVSNDHGRPRKRPKHLARGTGTPRGPLGPGAGSNTCGR